MHNTNKKIKIVGFNGRFTHSCLALFYVRNELEKNCQGVEIELCQFTINDNYYETLLRLTEGNPRNIFISAAIWNSSLVEKLVLDLRICLPSCWVVIGGPQSSVLGKRLGAEICTVVIGEVEALGREFYRHLGEGCLRPRYDAVFFTRQRRYFDYPYRDNDFAGQLRNRHIYYESSKGCPFHCSYCLSAADKGVFHKDLEVVKKELRHILSHGPRVIRFIDRTFNDVPERALAIWKFLMKEGGDTLFHFEMAPDRFNEEMFDFLAGIDPGRFQFEIGIQSTNIRSLEAVNRRISQKMAHQAVSRLAALGNIHLHVDLILGLPYETLETFKDSFRDVFAMGAHYIQMGLLKILPDTPLYKSAAEFEYLHSKEPPYAVLQSRWMNHSTLSELYWFSECVEKFVNNRYFVSFWDYLRRHGEDIFVFFEQLLFICKREGFFQLAVTQEKMTAILAELVSLRDDNDLILEILRYDWLRCGFRYLPACLKMADDREQPESTKSRLYQSLPMEIEGVYRKNYRNQFFRKSFFLQVSARMLRELGLASDSAQPSSSICVLTERQESLYCHNKVIVL